VLQPMNGINHRAGPRRAVSKKALHTRVALQSARLTWLTAVPRSSRSVPPGHREPVIDR